MSIQTSNALASFFRAEAGDGLRLVAHYDPDSHELLYVRDDLERRYEGADFEESFAMHRRDMRASREQQEVLQAGSHHVTLRIFDGAIVFNVAQTSEIGTVVSLEPAIGGELLSFATRMLEELDENSPQTVSAPAWAVE